MADDITVFGVRHHGPGCARSLRAGLAALAPDIVLVEGPPDGQEALPLLTHAAMRPPVALLVYAPELPRLAAFYPFAHYSPEWQALRYALEAGIPARFMDLPQAVRFARLRDEFARREAPVPTEPTPPDQAGPLASPAPAGPGASPGEVSPVAATDDAVPASAPAIQDDPIGALAAAAGYADHELWWERQVERRRDSRDLFAAIMEAMAALRAEAPAPGGEDAQREAAMRMAIRAARREGFRRLAVVCGAWHAPVLASPGPAAPDVALLAGLPPMKVQATWIPWTNSRLALRSGYGAGVVSPGWYEHLWSSPPPVGSRWLAKAARLLRVEDLDVSSAAIIEAVRLSEALAALRGGPEPGLAELNDAALAAFCGGDPAPLALIREKLEVGEALGAVPEEAPTTPLQADLLAHQCRLRLPPSAEQKTLDLDLRNDTDRRRSHLLHRLDALGVHWGARQRTAGMAGTFHEFWRLQWQPELRVALIEASVWGVTLAEAAAARLGHLAASAELPRLTELLDLATLADLPAAVAALLDAVQARSAQATDVRALLDALLPLARVARYGDVRQTRGDQVLPVIAALLARAGVGLPAACQSLDADAAGQMVASIERAQESVALLDRADWRNDWQAALRGVLARDTVHALVRGRAARLLFEARALDGAELSKLAHLALSPAVAADEAAAWLEGALRGSGLQLLHADDLWRALDGWLRALAADTFVAMLPALRRAFAGFQPPERRAMAEKVRRLAAPQDGAGPGGRLPTTWAAIDRRRADLTLPVLAHILGGRSMATDVAPTGDAALDAAEAERLRRWRLVLGEQAAALGEAAAALGGALSGDDRGMDRVLEALYGGERSAGLGSSAPNVTRWLGDIRAYFPTSAVRVMQQDALERLQLRRMLLEPELLAAATPDVQLVATLLTLSRVIPERTKETARQVVRQVVEDVERRLRNPLVQAVTGSLNRASRRYRPSFREIDWDRTIRANLKHYQPQQRTIIPERLIGHGRKRSSLRDVILCVDQSGSMATSVVYAGIFGAVLASIRAVDTRMVVFDTAVVDLTDDLTDPIDLLFGVQLGGGTDINRALAYCQGLVRRPTQTIMVLLSDLYEGGNAVEMRKRAAALIASGVRLICLLALSDQGAPGYQPGEAAAMAALGAPTFACTPDLFPELMAAAIQGQDLTLWAARRDVATVRAAQ